MKISVKVKPNAREYKVEQINNSNFSISVKEPPLEGKANQAVIELLSEYFKIPKSKITILRGLKSRHKIIEIGE